MVAKKIQVSGDVQGVGYRHWANKVADKLGLVGWTKNEHDGTVTIFIQGEDELVGEFIEWTHEGSPMATVTNVAVAETGTDDSLKRFEVR